ncbi:SPINW protein, partial [Rhinopomastus cyanomelas]|nr:SPINW protein [Rhinopomastus cyanomelas]
FVSVCRKQRKNVRPRKPVCRPRRNIVGCRIQHGWKDMNGLITYWKGTVLCQVPIMPSLYLIKYDGFDCVYAIELYKDENISALEVLPERVVSPRIRDVQLARKMVGKTVDHMFVSENGSDSKAPWKGLILDQVPIMKAFFYITYEKEPILFTYELLDDYKNGDLHFLPEPDQWLPRSLEGVAAENVLGRQVEHIKKDGSKRIGMVILDVESIPSVYLVKFVDDYYVYAYNVVKAA